MTTIPIAAPAVVQTEPQTPADRKTPKREAESNWFTPDELMSGVQSKALWIRQRTGLSDSATLLVDFRQETSDCRQLAIAIQCVVGDKVTVACLLIAALRPRNSFVVAVDASPPVHRAPV